MGAVPAQRYAVTSKTDTGLRNAFKRALRRPVYIVDGQARTMRKDA